MFGLTTDEDSDAGGAKAEDKARVETAKKEDDFLPTFQHQLTLGKSEAAIWKNFEFYKKKMSNKQIEDISLLIKQHYEKK